MDFSFSPEQQQLADRATAAGLEFREAAQNWDREDHVPYPELAKRMGELGFFGLTMPAEYGGQNGTALDYVVAASSVIRSSRSWAPAKPLFYTTGPGPSLMLLGNDTLRKKYVPDVVQGLRGCAIALTEPGHGSDLTHLSTTAKPSNGGYVVNGHKSFVTGVIENELYAVFARFDDVPGAKGVGVVIVERDLPGVRMEHGPVFLGDRGIPHGGLIMEDVVIPEENVIRGAGHFAEVMRAFNMERLHNASISLGYMEAAFDLASEYVQEREAFGRPIIEFQATYHALADMWVTLEAHRLLTYRAAATAVDGLFPRLLDVSVAKLFGGTLVPQVTMKAIELHGGNGVTMDFPVERLHRDAVTNIVAGGSPAVLRNGIAGQLFPNRRFPQTAPGPSGGHA
jgi:butyryl-CoA dehydrogenase